jgi:molybdopterin converting factor small subunit
MRIDIKLYGDLKKYAPSGLSEFSMTVPPATTLADIHAMLAIPGDDHISLINGRRTGRETRLEEGDTIVLMPPLAGG